MGLCSSKHTNTDYCTCKRCYQQRASDRQYQQHLVAQRNSDYSFSADEMSQPTTPTQPALRAHGHAALLVFVQKSTAAMPMWEMLVWRSISSDFREMIRDCATKISLRSCRADQTPGASGVLTLRKLRSISLRDSPLVTDDFVHKCLAGRPCLTAIDLSFCPQLTRLDNHFPELLSLKLAGTAITDDALIPLLRNCPKLVHLDLTQCDQLTNRGFAALGFVCPMLQSAVVANCWQLCNAGLAKLARGSRLIELNVAGCQVDDAALLDVMRLNPSLRALNVTGCSQLTDIFLEPLSWINEPSKGLTVCADLETLNLSDLVRLSDEAIQTASRARVQLRVLGVRARRILNSCPRVARRRLSADSMHTSSLAFSSHPRRQRRLKSLVNLPFDL